jgi:hypothetical protein
MVKFLEVSSQFVKHLHKKYLPLKIVSGKSYKDGPFALKRELILKFAGAVRTLCQCKNEKDSSFAPPPALAEAPAELSECLQQVDFEELCTALAQLDLQNEETCAREDENSLSHLWDSAVLAARGQRE